MKVAKWDNDTKVLYWKQKMNEQDILEAQKELRQKAFEKGIEKGKLKGEIKGEISKIKDFFELGVLQEQIIPKLKFLTNDKVRDKIDTNLTYIREHLEEADSDICDELGLVGDL